MNTKNNQRTRLSKMLFKNTLIDLLDQKGAISKISVRELCEKAELNRSTFYAHYNEPKDLLIELEEELLQSTKEHLEKIGAENDLGAHRYILSFLKYIKDNDKFFRTLLINSADPTFHSRFMQQSIIQFIENLEISFSKDIEQYVYSYILNGSSGIITQWIRSDYEADENTICELLFAINRSALININMQAKQPHNKS
ncbi:MAG: TetR-like C-terminal domain-containing protein [Clostridia bacterium]|nr:TetR-like C-terminal domain-containing protein [Clostridia bacterium]